METKKILVLLSVYNGQKYLREQVDSILSQQGVDLHLLIRDDGSKDASVAILNEYAAGNPKAEIVLGANLGCLGSFNALVDMACERKEEYEYFAFSDQDDYWLPDKLQAGVSQLSSCNSMEQKLPLMYFCNMMIADDDARPLFPLRAYSLKLKRANMLKSNKAAGCTMVFNRKMVEAYSLHPAVAPSLHDTWMMLIAMFIGNVFYDHNCYINYRQHRANVVGMHGLISWRTRWRQRVETYIRRTDSEQLQIVKKFRDIFYDDLSEADRRLMTTFIEYRNNWKCKCRLLFNYDFYPDMPIGKYLLKYTNHAFKLLFGKL